MKFKQYIIGVICTSLVVLLSGYLVCDTFVFSRAIASVSDDDREAVFSTILKNVEAAADADSNSFQSSETISEESDSFLTENRETKTMYISNGRKSKNPSRGKKDGSSDRSKSRNSSSETAYNQNDSTSVLTAGSEYAAYEDSNIKITLNQYRVLNTSVYVADIQAVSAYSLKTAFAQDTYGRNITAKTSSIAEENNAILAINGDYYGARESGYVIRNGIVYRNTSKTATDILCIYADGTMQIRNTGEVSAEELVEEGVWQAFSFGPALVENGSISVGLTEEVGKAMASNPRTVIGIIDSNHYLLVVSDGRTDESEGLSLYELASFMQSLGATTAYNLDGGGSSTMWYLGEVINKPTTNGSIKERGVSDIVYIG